jgi:LPS sulfotransferase NodH/glycosyltransferase involved in cell wall biosynthesis
VTPLVSVVVKAYNHAPYVEHAIRSVLDQSFEDFELVVTDDASTDATPELIAGFMDPRIRFERFTSNRGIAAAMNATVRRARGEFVAILNSDDVALPRRLETQLSSLRERPGVAAVFSVPLQIDESGQPAEGYGRLFAVPFADPEPTRQQWLRHFFFNGNCLCAPTAMIRRAAFEAIGPDDERLAHLVDLDRWIRLLEKHEIHVLDEPVTAFRVRSNNMNAGASRSDTRLRDAYESFEIFKRYRRFDAGFVREIFADDIAREGIDRTLSNDALLGELALTGRNVWHPIFALDSLFRAARFQPHASRVRELTGRVDPFRIFVEGARPQNPAPSHSRGVTMRGFALCTVGRSGSNWLCELLSSTGRLGNPQEYFNAAGRRRFLDPAYPDDPSEQIRWILTRSASVNGVYGLKVFPSQLDTIAGRVRWADALPGLRYVHLVRGDVLGQAISLARANQTGRFRSTLLESAVPQYDGEAILANIRLFAHDNARWTAFFARNGIAPLTLTYEGVAADPRSAVASIANLMEVPDAHVDLSRVQQEVTRDELSESWRRRFLAEHADPNVVDEI